MNKILTNKELWLKIITGILLLPLLAEVAIISYLVIDLAKSSLTLGSDPFAYLAFPFVVAIWTAAIAFVIWMFLRICFKISSPSQAGKMIVINTVLLILDYCILYYNIRDYATELSYISGHLTGFFYGFFIFAPIPIGIGLLVNVIVATFKLHLSRIGTYTIAGILTLVFLPITLHLAEATFYPNCLAAAHNGNKELIFYCAQYMDRGYLKLALEKALFEDRTEVAKSLLQAGAVSYFNYIPELTRAEAAASCNDLLPNSHPNTSKSDLLLAAAYKTGCADAVQALLDAGADVNARGGWERTPLMNAVLAGNTESVKILLAAGADVNLRDDLLKRTALMHAVRNRSNNTGTVEIIKMLLAAGADVDMEDSAGRTTYAQASSKDIVKLLEAAKAKK